MMLCYVSIQYYTYLQCLLWNNQHVELNCNKMLSFPLHLIDDGVTRMSMEGEEGKRRPHVSTDCSDWGCCSFCPHAPGDVPLVYICMHTELERKAVMLLLWHAHCVVLFLTPGKAPPLDTPSLQECSSPQWHQCSDGLGSCTGARIAFFSCRANQALPR